MRVPRTFIVIYTLALVVIIAAGSYFVVRQDAISDRNRDLIEENRAQDERQRALDCDVARLVSVSPIVSRQRQPFDLDKHEFARRKRIVSAFLKAVRNGEHRCRNIGRTAPMGGGDPQQSGSSPGQQPGPGQGPPPNNGGGGGGGTPKPPPRDPGLLDQVCNNNDTAPLLGAVCKEITP